jgi:hypothetical protein
VVRQKEAQGDEVMAKQQWRAVGPVTTERSKLVENAETGEQGFRAVRWVDGHPQLYGGVYSAPSSDEPGCRRLCRVEDVA